MISIRQKQKTKKNDFFFLFFFLIFFYQVSQFHHRAIKDKIEENETHVVVIIAGLSYKKW